MHAEINYLTSYIFCATYITYYEQEEVAVLIKLYLSLFIPIINYNNLNAGNGCHESA